MTDLNLAVIGLSSNLGNKKQHLLQATTIISANSNCQIEQKSSIFETSAWGLEEQPNYYNQVITVKTSLNPSQLLQFLQSIEIELKRVKTIKYGPRTIDLDILFYSNLSINTAELTIPHPLIQERNFVLAPLNQILPDFVHPILKKTINQLFQECLDQKNYVQL